MGTSSKGIHLALYRVSLGPAGLISSLLQPCKIWISPCKASGHSSPLQSQRIGETEPVPCCFPEETLGRQCRRTTVAQHLTCLYTNPAWIEHWRFSCTPSHLQVPAADPARSMAVLGQAKGPGKGLSLAAPLENSPGM